MDCSATVLKIAPGIAKVYCLNAQGRVVGTGSGFLYAKKGILVTCDHVIEGAQTIVCKFSDEDNKTFHTTKVALQDKEHDLALLKVEVDRNPLATLSARALKEVRPGMPVLFSGYPLSLETLTTHQGILSAITRDEVGVTTYLIDGTVNSGNSGCPLMNAAGEVLGVVNAKRRERSDLLSKVEGMTMGAVSLHGIDLVEIYQALISNVQLGIGYAVPASYIPKHTEIMNTQKKRTATRRSRSRARRKK
jgi:S1-C subfamily serine protease